MAEPTELRYEFAPDERAALPGGPAVPKHPVLRRLGYVLVGTFIGAGATLGNALVNVNSSYLAGSLGEYVAPTSLLPALYFAMVASANLTLVKARTQFGIPAVTNLTLVLYAVAGFFPLILPGFLSEALVRAASGMAGASLITLSTYYFLQVFPGNLRPLALVTSVGLVQLGTPLARLFPVEMLELGHWHNLHLLELALAFGALAAISALPLPPSERQKSFEPLDFVTISLLVPAYCLICTVLSQGRLLWWTDTPWLGWALAASVPLFATAYLIEHHRAHPLLKLRWIGSLDILRFAAIALFVRLTLSEQTYGSIGLMALRGLNNDQLHTMFTVILLAMLLGIATAALTLSEKRIPYQVMTAAVVIGLGSWIEIGASNVTGPTQLIFSQALIGFGTTLFIGPALVYGFIRMIRFGGDHLASFIVLFSTTQNIGALAGTALLGTYQVVSMHAHAATLSEQLMAENPLVAARLQAGAAAIAGAVTDPGLRTASGAGLLGQAMTHEASLLAFNDVSRGIALLAVCTAFYVGYLLILKADRQRPQTSLENS